MKSLPPTIATCRQLCLAFLFLGSIIVASSAGADEPKPLCKAGRCCGDGIPEPEGTNCGFCHSCNDRGECVKAGLGEDPNNNCDDGFACDQHADCAPCGVPDCSGKDCGSDGCGGSCPNKCIGSKVCFQFECCVTVCGGECCKLGEICPEETDVCCKPQCSGKNCGPDGCGGTCGTCALPAKCFPDGICHVEPCGDKHCDAGLVCVKSSWECCEPQCAGKDCGPDGCGGSCGECLSAEAPCIEGECCASHCYGDCCEQNEVCFAGKCCTNSCEGMECGLNKCGVGCGTCGESQACFENVCCNNLCNGTCCDPEPECVDGKCCTPECKPGWECGDDNCGGKDACKTCPAEGDLCIEHVCCPADRACKNGCCPEGKVCHHQACCKPQCNGKECGDDGCGGSCAPGCTGEGEICIEGNCCLRHCHGAFCCDDDQVCHHNACCPPVCDDKACGSDGCGGSCGDCEKPTECIGFECCEEPCWGECCKDDKVCYKGGCCEPKCSAPGRCGDNGCGGSCAACGSGAACLDGFCTKCECSGPSPCCSNGCTFDAEDTPCDICRSCDDAGHCLGAEDGTDPNNECGGKEHFCWEGYCNYGPSCNEQEECPEGSFCVGNRCTPKELLEAGSGSDGCSVSGDAHESGWLVLLGLLLSILLLVRGLPRRTWCILAVLGLLSMAAACEGEPARSPCCNVLCPDGHHCEEGKCVCDPVCGDLECGGDNGCGGNCGECEPGNECLDGKCCSNPCVDECCDMQTVCFRQECCTPECEGKECGDDGCGGTCGTCNYHGECIDAGCCDVPCDGLCCKAEEGEVCFVDSCCVPACDDPEKCGDDGCGGSCGDCAAGKECIDSLCCESSLVCGGECCEEMQVCFSNYCCTPECTGKECGEDGCGGSCGDCDPDVPCIDDKCCPNPCDQEYPECCPEGQVCVDDEFCCAPKCADKECGDDGCSGTCGECNDGIPCIDHVCCVDYCGEACCSGVCVNQEYCCHPECEGKDCGDDGCGGNCDECDPGNECIDFGCCQSPLVCDGVCCLDGQVCVGEPGSRICCTPFCQPGFAGGAECGLDGCGGSCGECGEEGLPCIGGECCMPCAWSTSCCQDGEVCHEEKCCTPDCAGKECGDDDCGGQCPQQCDDGYYCEDYQCVLDKSCKDHCGEQAPQGCWCDNVCPEFFDCCEVYCKTIGQEETDFATSEPLKVDYVMAVDNTGSMSVATEAIQNNIGVLVAKLSNLEQNDGFDYHFVLISKRDIAGGSNCNHPLCMPSPLAGDSDCGNNPPGTGDCAPPSSDCKFLHIDHCVGNYNSFELIVGCYDDDEDKCSGSSYEDMLRADALLRVIIVTDDNAVPTNDAVENLAAWKKFRDDLLAKTGKDEFVLHAVASYAIKPNDPLPPPAVPPKCGASRVGSAYWEGKVETEGEWAEICADWGSGFFDDVFKATKALLEVRFALANIPVNGEASIKVEVDGTKLDDDLWDYEESVDEDGNPKHEVVLKPPPDEGSTVVITVETLTGWEVE